MLLDLKQQFENRCPDQTIALPRGVALHFAPGNVDTIFLYSALLAVLMGNRNFARISSRQSPQIELLIRVLKQILTDPEHTLMRSRLLIIRYGHNEHITRELSAHCDLRVIWGGVMIA